MIVAAWRQRHGRRLEAQSAVAKPVGDVEGRWEIAAAQEARIVADQVTGQVAAHVGTGFRRGSPPRYDLTQRQTARCDQATVEKIPPRNLRGAGTISGLPVRASHMLLPQ